MDAGEVHYASPSFIMKKQMMSYSSALLCVELCVLCV